MAGGQVAFMSYARFDNDQYDGQISEFRRLLSAEVKAQTGAEFEIFEDREHISWGQNWQEVIDQALDTVALLLVIITPGYFRSEACRAEVTRFWQRERELGRSDLILPVYYITAKEIEEPAARRADEVASMLASRQFVDWRDLRLEPVDSPVVRKAVAQLASRMRTAFWRTPQAQPFQGATGPPDAWPASPAVPASPGPAYLPKWDGYAPRPAPEAQRPAPYPGGAGGATPPQRPRQRVLSFPPNRRTALAAGALAALLAVGGTLYAIEATGTGHGPSSGPGSGPGSGSHAAGPTANLAATLTVPGGGTVDTVWISPDGKRIAAARTDQASSIYVWNTASPGAGPTEVTVPPMEVGGAAYPTMIENVAFGADDATMTMIGYPASNGAASGQSYVLYQWNLATGSRSMPWSITGTSSNISFSNDNSTAVESVNGGASVLTLLPQQTSPAPLAVPGGSALVANTSYYLDLNGKRMLYSPKRGTYSVWDFTENKVIGTWNAPGLSYLSPDGKTALVFYDSGNDTTGFFLPVLLDLATGAKVTPADARWQDQLVSSKTADAYVTYSTDGTVITTERAGGKTDLWSAETDKFLLTISDPNYRADSDYAVVGPHGGEVVIFAQRVGPASGHEFRQLDIWDTGLGS